EDAAGDDHFLVVGRGRGAFVGRRRVGNRRQFGSGGVVSRPARRKESRPRRGEGQGRQDGGENLPARQRPHRAGRQGGHGRRPRRLTRRRGQGRAGGGAGQRRRHRGGGHAGREQGRERQPAALQPDPQAVPALF